MITGRDWRAIAGRTGYVMSCALGAIVVAVAGYAHYVENQVGGLGSSNVDTGGPQTGAMNILLMGLESRTDYDGNILPASLLAAMHAGSVNGVENGVGGEDTNTLILIHIFAGGQKAVGFSIPRDDLVTYAHPTYLGITQGKIDQAYDFAYNQSLGQTVTSHMSQDQRFTLANEAGQAFEIAAVQAVTGVHIDHFLEMNLAGFYNLAQGFNGIEACVKPAPAQGGFPAGANLTDYDAITGTDNSGFNAYRDGYNRKKGGAQYLHLNGAQSLAFVRSRDTLPGVDLGRTTRQQAVIDYVIWKLGHQGVLTSFSQLTNLLAIAKKYIVAPAGWDLPTFAGEMHALTGKNLRLSTLPVTSTPAVDLNGSRQDVNIIDVPYIRQLVQSAFSRPPGTKTKASKTPAKTSSIPPPSAVTVDVYNGGTTNMLAARVSQALVSAGYKAGAVAIPAEQRQTVQAATQVFYGAGASANAAKIAGYFGATATAANSVAAGHVEVLLGTTSTVVPAGLGRSSPASPSATATSPASHGQAGSAVTVKANAPYGIPCVD